jgi:C1A family cysteine protease
MNHAKAHPEDLESDYPYQASTLNCRESQHTGKVTVKTVTNVTPNSVSQLKAAIAKSPVSVSVEADKTVFQQYKTGILDSAACGTATDHAITAVGYGTESGKDYYLVRNSWGAGWGDKGYIKIAAKDGPGICGIQKAPVFPTTN